MDGIWRRKVFLAGVLLLAMAFASFSATRCQWIYLKGDNREATDLFAAFLEDHEVDIYSVRDYFVVVQDKFRILMEPKMSVDDLDRIVVHVIFSVKSFYKGSRSILDFVNGLNRKYNIGGFYINDEGDFAFQTQLTFIDYLCWDEVGAFIEWVNRSLFTIIKANQEEFSRYLE